MSIPAIDIRPDHWEIVRHILHLHVPHYAVWAFGSRAKWTAKPHSDLDLAVIADKPLPLAVSAALADDFSQSNLPWKVDVVDWAATSEPFRAVIERDKVVVQKSTPPSGVEAEWRVYRLDDLCEFINGFSFKSTDYVPPSVDTIEVFRLGYIERGGGFKEDSSPVFVQKNYGRRKLEKFFLQLGDVTIAMTDMRDRVAILGNTAWIQDSNRFVLNQRVGRIRVIQQDLLDPKYFYFYSNWEPYVDYLRSRANSGVQVNLPISAIKESKLYIPPIEEQRAIAHILGTLDDKIELNRKMNKTLEAMAQALFKSWFVDFDPVRAKAEGRAPTGMDAETAKLFPSEFVESELGQIPKGWRVTSLDSIAYYLNGLAMQKFPSESETEFLPVIKIAQLRAGNTDGADKASTKLKLEYIVEDGDVLFSWSGSLEVEVWMGGRGALNQHLYKITSGEVPKWFYYFATRQHLSDFRAIAAGKATTMGHIQRKHLTDAKVVVPPPNMMKEFDATIAPLFEQKINNALQTRSLAGLRDALLPKLLSGDLRVPEAKSESQ